MKRTIAIFLGLFAIGAGVTLAFRMSADAMAVIVGVGFGLLATVPTTFILLYTLRRNDAQQNQYRQQAGQYPPVIVVNSGQNGSAGSGYPGLAAPGIGERNFKVVGGESTAQETLSDAFNLNSIWDEV